MSSDPFAFNTKAKYEPGPQKDSAGDIGNPSKGRIQVKHNDPHGSFNVEYTDVFEYYKLPLVYSKKMIDTWSTHPMQFWQNQLNFAVWCATTGCGVSFEDHLNSEIDLVKSLYRFHLYYQVRRILVTIKAKQPQDEGWGQLNNSYSTREYENICKEFGVSPNTNWKVEAANDGLGTEYGTDGNPASNYYEQDFYEADKAWKTFIIAKSKGFTTPGVTRLNDSIRTYIWAILSAQVQTYSNIVGPGGTGTPLEAQKQYLFNVERAIMAEESIYREIKRYQRDLGKSGYMVNFSLGIGLYMIPSDMLLHLGKIMGYNNNIITATDEQPVGLHSGLNKSIAPQDAENDTGEEGLVKPDRGSRTTQSPAPKSRPSRIGNTDHEDEKTALIVAGVAAGLLALWVLW